MKTFIILALLLMLSSTMKAQNAKITKDGNYISIPSNKKSASLTGKTFTDVDKNISYPVYVTDKGKLFIIKKSKKTGKEYRFYLKLTK